MLHVCLMHILDATDSACGRRSNDILGPTGTCSTRYISDTHATINYTKTPTYCSPRRHLRHGTKSICLHLKLEAVLQSSPHPSSCNDVSTRTTSIKVCVSPRVLLTFIPLPPEAASFDSYSPILCVHTPSGYLPHPTASSPFLVAKMPSLSAIEDAAKETGPIPGRTIAVIVLLLLTFIATVTFLCYYGKLRSCLSCRSRAKTQPSPPVTAVARCGGLTHPATAAPRSIGMHRSADHSHANGDYPRSSTNAS
ncbi:hypothetical protein C2E23DRAFT_327279 [Lenzites betulinus]|nr:hypothetical protein C2E23DRAFT_327279 [Lenzites betulinus]